MGRPQIYDHALRERLLREAGEQVFTHGIASLSLRALAADAGTTTAAIYALFGNKGGLHAALYEGAVDRFAAALNAVRPSTDPGEDVVRLGLAYRSAALADPHGYRIMFGDGSNPLDIDRALARRGADTFAPLLDAVRRGVEGHIFPANPPAEGIGTALWANVHGLVTLELGVLLPPAAGGVGPVAEAALRAAVRGWTLPPVGG